MKGEFDYFMIMKKKYCLILLMQQSHWPTLTPSIFLFSTQPKKNKKNQKIRQNSLDDLPWNCNCISWCVMMMTIQTLVSLFFFGQIFISRFQRTLPGWCSCLKSWAQLSSSAFTHNHLLQSFFHDRRVCVWTQTRADILACRQLKRDTKKWHDYVYTIHPLARGV